eukprot:SAG22_NODE_2962_length_2069_cov_1.488325_1_plen_416_part_10
MSHRLSLRNHHMSKLRTARAGKTCNAYATRTARLRICVVVFATPLLPLRLQLPDMVIVAATVYAVTVDTEALSPSQVACYFHGGEAALSVMPAAGMHSRAAVHDATTSITSSIQIHFGDTIEDHAMKALMTTRRESKTSGGLIPRLLIELFGVHVGVHYKIQLLFAGKSAANTSFSILSNGQLLIKNFNPAPAGVDSATSQGKFAQFSLLSLSNSIQLELISTNRGSPYISAFTVEQMSFSSQLVELVRDLQLPAAAARSGSTSDDGGDAHRAIDGNFDTDFHHGESCAKTLREALAWWQVDLSRRVMVDHVALYHRSDAQQAALIEAGARITVSRQACGLCNGGYMRGEAPDVFDCQPLTDVTQVPENVDCKTPDGALATGRYLTIHVGEASPPKEGVIQLCEIEVWGRLPIEQS